MSGDYSHNIDKVIKYALDDPLWGIHNHGIDLKANHIYLMGEEHYIHPDSEGEPGVEFAMANKFIKNLNILMRQSTKPILIHMKTCGGYWPEGMAIYDAIRACPNEICILNYTHARSMSSIIFQAADKRVMMPNSVFMFHHGTMGMHGTTTQFLTEAIELKKTQKVMLDIYIDRIKEKGKYSKWSRKRIEDMLEKQMQLKEEVYLSAKETLEWGFADDIFGIDGKYDWSKLLEF